MARNYIDSNARFVARDIVLVDMIYDDGTTVCELEPRRLFPINDDNKYISLIDKDGKLRVDKADPIAYAHGEYFALGKKTGSFGFSVRKKKNTKK